MKTLSALGAISFFLADALFKKALEDKLFNFIPENLRPMISELLLLGGFGYFCFLLGKAYVSDEKPISKFKRFISRKIKEGEKILRSDLQDKLIQRTESGAMDHIQIENFNTAYKNWKASVHKGFKNATAFKSLTVFNIPEIDATVSVYGGGREYLKREIEILKDTKRTIMSDMLDGNFNPEFLDEY